MIVPVSLAALCQRISEAENLASFLDVFRTAGFAVDSWRAGGGFHTLTRACSRGLTALSEVVQQIARGGFLDLASGDWLTLLARSWFGVTRRPASYTYQTLRLSSSAAAPPYTIVPGQVWASTSATPGQGYRFNNTTGGTLPSGGTLNVTIKAESPGAAYNAELHAVSVMVTSLPGVTCDNVAVVTEGLNEESDPELKARCRGRWPTLSAPEHMPGGGYEFLAKTDPLTGEARPGVTRAYCDIDNPDGPGTVRVYLAGPEGPVDGSVVTAVDADLQPRRGASCTLTTLSAVEREITPEGTVWVYGRLASAAAPEGRAALDALLAAALIGGNVWGTSRGIFRDELEQALRAVPGVVRVSLTTGDHTLLPYEVATADPIYPGIQFEDA